MQINGSRDIREILKQGVSGTYDRSLYDRIRKNWDKVAKPLDSMGRFEDLTAKVGAIQGRIDPAFEKSAILVFCADNGIVEEHVSQSGQEVTAICAENIAAGKTAVGVMAAMIRADVTAVNVGIANPVSDAVLPFCVRKGTRNFLKEPAMTGEEVYQAMQTGMDLVLAWKQKGYQLLGIGEMGIGNTTTSAAMAAVMLGLSADTVTGKGAGLDEQGLTHKKEVIEQALSRYGLRETDTFTILQTVGGLDIAAMAGAIIGGAVYHMPIVLDGVISLVAALVAERLLPNVRDFLIPSHRSKEPAAEKISEKLRLDPVIDAKMAVGEGTGAVMMLTLLKQAALVYQSCNSFEAAGVEQYERYTK